MIGLISISAGFKILLKSLRFGKLYKASDVNKDITLKAKAKAKDLAFTQRAKSNHCYFHDSAQIVM